MSWLWLIAPVLGLVAVFFGVKDRLTGKAYGAERAMRIASDRRADALEAIIREANLPELDDLDAAIELFDEEAANRR